MKENTPPKKCWEFAYEEMDLIDALNMLLKKAEAGILSGLI